MTVAIQLGDRLLCSTNKQLRELLLQSLEHERGGVKVYETAVSMGRCPDLKKEWSEYLDQTREARSDSGRSFREVRDRSGGAFARARNRSRSRRAPWSKRCRRRKTLATRRRPNSSRANALQYSPSPRTMRDWELLSKCAEKLKGAQKQALQEACEEGGGAGR